MGEDAQYTTEQVASVEAKLKDFYLQLPEDERPVLEALLDQAFAELSGQSFLALTNFGWTFFPSYVGGFFDTVGRFPTDPTGVGIPPNPIIPPNTVRPQQRST